MPKYTLFFNSNTHKAQDAAGCSKTVTSVIYQPDAPLVSTAAYASTTNATCLYVISYLTSNITTIINNI